MVHRKHIMIDIETLGVKPSAPVLSIGAVAFDPEHSGWMEPVYHKGQPHSFAASVDLADALRYGVGVEAGALRFWLGQEDEARAALTDGRYTDRSMIEALADLSRFVHSFSSESDEQIRTNGGPRDVYVWANSNKFDLGLLEDKYVRTAMTVPWNYARDLNVRNMGWLCKTLFGQDGKPERTELEHDPLQDAIYQARHVERVTYALIKGELV